jgi:DUF438 domain-containing protein
MFEKEIEVWGKPLERMTTTDLKEAAKSIPDLTGVHGMKKEELIAALRKSKGIEAPKARRVVDSIRNLKRQIKALKEKRAEAITAKDRKTSAVSKRRISRLKKMTRRAAV